MPSPELHPRDPLHGITLERIVQELQARHGWREMSRRIPIRCFQFNPSVKSSLTFLRKTPWARAKVEAWFIEEADAGCGPQERQPLYARPRRAEPRTPPAGTRAATDARGRHPSADARARKP